jgi:hypothetical protein
MLPLVLVLTFGSDAMEIAVQTILLLLYGVMVVQPHLVETQI